ncbi:MAG: PhoH family protein [Candidatus Omnitrophica bacterium]|nr:PhoH family protein [Candidatus Omnitrophota bacterium]
MQKIIHLQNNQEAQSLFGTCDKNIRAIEKEYKIKINTRGEKLKLSGNSRGVQKAAILVNSLLGPIRQGRAGHTAVTQSSSVHKIIPKTKGQRDYVQAIDKYDIVFSVGPAGTGKTYLAVWQAQDALKKGLVRRIILTRPAIEAGESLGFLPGDMYEKISPYLRPLYDALYDMIDADIIEKYIDTGIIEVAPLAYMRGRTLNDAFIILDEAQNCTVEQMKMFLTRLGFDSKAVITGDITQSDLPAGKPTGLLQAQEILKNIKGIKFIYLSRRDVVRHELVQKIIEAYEKTSHKK